MANSNNILPVATTNLQLLYVNLGLQPPTWSVDLSLLSKGGEAIFVFF